MAGPTIAHAEIQVDYDGSRLPGQAKALAEKAGKGSGYAFTDGFSDGLNEFSRMITKNLAKSGKAGGDDFAKAFSDKARAELSKKSRGIIDALYDQDGFNRFAKGLGGSQHAVDELKNALQNLADSGQLSEAKFEKMRAGVQRWADELHNAEIASEQEAAATKKAAEDKLADLARLQVAREQEKAELRAATQERLENLARERAAAELSRKNNARLAQSLKDLNLHLTGSGWKTLIDDSDDAAASVGRLRTQVDHLNDAGKISNDQTKVYHARITELASAQKDVADSTERVGRAVSKNDKTWTKHLDVVNNIRNSYRRMDGTVRLVIGSILVGAEQIAALGPALGVGITVLGGAVAALGVAAGVAIAGLKDLNGDAAKLGPNARKAQVGLKSLTATLGSMQDEIEEVMTDGLEEFFFDLASAASKLQPAFLKVAGAVRETLIAFGRWADSSSAIQRMNTFIERSAGYFQKAMAAVGRFGDALLTVFASSGFDRVMNEFLDWVQDIATAFDDFANSNNLDTWFDRASRVFGAVGRLLDSTLQTLADLVDDQAIDRLTATLDSLSEAMPKLGDVLDTLGDLDIFGLLGEALNGILDAVEPLLVPLGNLFEVLNDIIGVAIDEWADALADAAEGLAPLIQGLADALSGMDAGTIRGIANAVLALAGAFVIFKGAKGIAGVAASLDLVIGKFDKLGKFKGLAKGFGGAAAGALGATIAGELGSQLSDDPIWSTAGEKAGGIFGGAASGAMVGGPWGAAAGAIIGAVTSADWQGMWDGIFGGSTDGAKGLELALTGGLLGAIAGLATAVRAAGNGTGNEFVAGVQEGLNGMVPGLGDWFVSTSQAIGAWVSQVIETISGMFAGIGTTFSGIWTGITDGINGFFTWWVEFWAGFFAPVFAILNPVVAAFIQIWQSMVDTVSTIWNGFATLIGGVWAIISSIIQLGLQTISFVWNTVWNAVLTVFTSMWNRLVSFLRPIITVVVSAIKGPIDAIVGWWNGLWSGVSSSFQSKWNQIVNFIGPIVARISNAIRSAFDTFNGWWQGLWSGVASFFSGIWSGIESTARGAINGIIDVINGLLGPIQSVADALSNLSGGAINVDIPNLPKLASGAVVNGPTRALIGENGPEAIVPLNRPLSRVDPSVRLLSAIAQGYTGGVGGRGGVVVEAGAVQVNGVLDPQRASLLVVNRLAERIMG